MVRGLGLRPKIVNYLIHCVLDFAALFSHGMSIPLETAFAVPMSPALGATKRHAASASVRICIEHCLVTP
jgi:hypothetical protein